MKHLNTLFVLTFSFFCISTAFAKSNGRVFYDVSQFDISGVKLGMNLKEAKAALVKNLDISGADIVPERYSKKNPVLNQKIPLYYETKKGNAKIVVYFSPAIPIDKVNPLRVKMVIYRLPRSPDNLWGIKELAYKKYGKPTSGNATSKLTEVTWCNAEENQKRFGCGNPKGAIMTAGNSIGSEISMRDPKYDNAVQKYLREKKTVKPSF